jgi:hypothetical protein
MSNNKQSSVEWLSNQTYELFEQYSEGNFDRITLNKLMLEATNKAKEMHKKEIKDAIFWGNIKGYDEHKRTWVFDEDEQYYNEKYGGGKK